ncbi:PREDICTED: regulator of telomere elongation helicase 1-like [Gekko japonicus]|uniref:Regulator of telomere elongation helicase 1-like n=1 Tax=Gekko japonicus TaxID=146911 RepID=A0ABM1KX92_GEKJA|nr:PREDICTED: regulator of telomere elongation helicase 1-like [Gekko japonicus]
MFVRPHHKKRFRQMCQDLTGMSCPEDSKELPLPAQEHGFLGPEGSCPATEEAEIQAGAAAPTPGSSKSEALKKSPGTACPAVCSESRVNETVGSSSWVRPPTGSDVAPLSPVNSCQEMPRMPS